MLGDVVRARRRRLGWSQEDLATKTGVSVRGIRKIEAHQTETPRPATVRLLADAFGLAGAERDAFCAAALGEVCDPATGQSGPPPWPVGAPISSRPPSGVCGRERELAELHSRAAATADGVFQIVWIGGEAGAGKSTLAKALTSTLARHGWNTAWGSSPEVEGTPPAWAWADVVRGLIGGTVVGGRTADDSDLNDRLRPLLGDGTPATAPARATIAPFWMARAVVDFLRRCAEPQPLLVVLDDVHRAGEETLEILRYAATELADRPVLVVATFRPTEVSGALTATWAALTGPRARQLDLGGLAEPDVGRLLEEVLGDAVSPEAVRLITARTGGNPLFVGETARLIAAEGIVAATELVPTGVVNVLRRRLAGLPAPAQAVLRTAAVFGIDIDTEDLLSLDPTAVDTVLDGLEAAVRAGLLTELTPGSVRFSHVLVRDTIYQDLPCLRRVRLHAQVLATLEQAQSGDIAALAHHALAAATPATARSAAARALDAAHAASAVCAHQEAAALLVRGLGTLDLTGHRDAAEPERRLGHVVKAGDLRLDLLCALVSAQGHAGNVRGARASRGRAIQLAHVLGDHRRSARAYTCYDAPTLWSLREYDEFDCGLVEGLEATLVATPHDDPTTRCKLLATLAMETEAHDPDRTDAASSEAVAIAGRLDDPGLLCRALNARYRYLATLGPDRWTELESIGRQQLAVATTAGLSAYQAQGHHILCMAQLARNDLDQAQWHLDRAVEHATSGQLGLALGILGMFAGLRDLIAGRFDQAERTYASVIAQLGDVGTPNVEELELLVRFCIEHARAGPGIRPQMVAIAERSGPVYERFGDAVTEPFIRILIAAGHLDEARDLWRPDIPIRRDHYWFRWTALRAENAVHLRDLDTAATCYQQLLPWAGHLPGLLHAHVTLGPVDHTLGDLAIALHRPVVATRHYADAIRVAEQVGASHWADRSRDALRELSCGAGPAACSNER
jgi:DNA-binding XRE family transcriptional regulator